MITHEDRIAMNGMPDNLGVLPKLALLRAAQHLLSRNLPESKAEWALLHMENTRLVGFCERLLEERVPTGSERAPASSRPPAEDNRQNPRKGDLEHPWRNSMDR